MRIERKQALLGLLLVLPAFIVTMTVITLPVLQSAAISFRDPVSGAWSLSNYRLLFTDKNSVANIWYTLRIVISTVVLAVALAYPLSLYVSFGTGGFAAAVRRLYLIPRFIPGIVAVYAIMGVLRDTGAINRFLLLFGINFKPSLMYTPRGIVLVNLWFNIPFATMLISAALSGIPASVIESARDIGAGRFRRFIAIILPLSAKAALVAAVFVFMGNVGEFTTPFLMGTNAPRMLGVAVYQEFGVFYNVPASAALSVFMFALSSVAGFVYIRSMMKEEAWRAR